MLKALAASTALKYTAACVCPVAGMAAVTLASPKVRAAVHKATDAPRHARAKPRAKAPARADKPETLADAAGRDCLQPAVDFAGRGPEQAGLE